MDANVQSNDWLANEMKPKISYIGQFGILIGLVGVGIIFAGVLQIGFMLSMGCSLNELLKGDEDKMIAIMAKPENFTKAILMQTLGTFILMVIPAYILTKILTKNALNYLGFNKNVSFKKILLAIAIAIFGVILSLSLGELNKYLPYPNSWKIKAEKMEENYAKSVLIFANIKTMADYFLSIFMIAILPAIFEELLFRAALQKLLINWIKKPHIAILIASILFSLAHFSIYGFISRMALGMVLGYLYFYGKSIWLNILMHFINNAIGITSIYLAMKNGDSLKKSMDETLPIWVLPIALMFTIILLVVYKKISEKNNLEIN